jgi:hypothetical protein
MQHLYQIMIPLPTGVFVLVSIVFNVLIFSLHLLDTSPSIEILPAESGGSENGSGSSSTPPSPGLTLQVGRFRKSSTRITIDAQGIQEFGTIHQNGSWMLLYILGIGWSLYLLFQSVTLINVAAWNQGELFLCYSLVSIFGYGFMFFLPEKKITSWDKTGNRSVCMIIPPVLLSFSPTPRIYLGGSFIAKFGALVQYRPPVLSARFSHALHGIYLPNLVLWTLIVLGASKFLGNLYNYQFVEPVAVVWLLYEIRNVLYNNEQIETLQYPRRRPTKPTWYYLGWLFVWHELGFKAWYVTSFLLFSSLSPGWIPYVVWGLYLLTCGAIVWEIKRLQFWPTLGRSRKMLLLMAIITELFLQFSAVLSICGILPVYLSSIGFGPLI